MDERQEVEPKPAEEIPVAQFEGEFIREMEGKLPAIVLGMPAGYARGTHLKLELEVRVRNVRYEEIVSGPDKGDLKRQHIFAIEEATIVGAYTAEELDPGVGGSASATAIGAEPEPEVDDEGQLPATGTDVGF